MSWEVHGYSDLFTRIDQWKQEVVKDTLQQGAIKQQPSQSNSVHRMNLRSRATRPALAEVSGNPHSRKRKASVVMADTAAIKARKKAAKDGDIGEVIQRPGRRRPAKKSEVDIDEDETLEQLPPRRRGRSAKNLEVDIDEDETLEQPAPRRRIRSAKNSEVDLDEDETLEQPAPRPRGRPPKPQDQELMNPREWDLQLRPGFAPTIWSPSAPTSPRKAGTSPSKRQLTLNKPISEAAIDMEYLSRCDPAVYLTTFYDLRVQGMKVVSVVEELFIKLQQIPHGVIPSALEQIYEEDANTPRKSKEPNLKSHYLEAGKTPFPPHCVDRMKSTVDNVLRKARRAQSQNAHEKQWGVIVTQLLCEVEFWQKSPEQIIVLNVETCSIQPVEIRSRKPDGRLPIDCDAQTVSSDAKPKTPPENIGRMVDYCLGMNVDPDDMKVIRRAYAKAEDNGASLNQSLSYIRTHPLILDIEIKKTLQPRDPQVQLAIWASSALLKKRLHGWNTSMPMPAVVVNGHSWEYYIFFEQDEDLMMAGPYPFGTTATLPGIWTIFHRLHIIMEWGLTEYKDWFQDHVMESARRYVGV